ncbi:hypothetical protein ACIN5162_1832 [Acinetobacter baumannii OIFC0162]|uniref:hypothetical protein n=1 Tax=Acinetobacter baumannii TaxID=470 RepID=UPI00028C15CB|nr:hypothetical protein [Acinetobacter baumannii]EHU2650156.1 hypothetical protein [Acinetobacter baumannii]EHU2652360.1 hypothetical protein [Acinetobacter baumannii]EKK06188.1 hypothetical protein ACIN5162_1832 [Acinetobacter baumannii OIFC0162]TPS85184.1 hypothetical protein FJU80_00890 [Acinetobacter baumannii]TPT55039.1 hypothetical protein FJU64_09605 [Acinetobacter baumannii]
MATTQTNIFFQASGYVSQRNLPIIKNIEDIIYTEKFEQTSYDHWLFLDETPLVGRVNNRVLSLQGGATVPPVYSSEGMALANAKGSAMLTDLTDNSSTSITAVYVTKCTTDTLHLLGMTLPNTNAPNENGFGAYLSGNKAYLNLKPLLANSGGALQGLTNNQAITQAEFCITAVSVNKSTNEVILYTQQNGVESWVEGSFSGIYENMAKKIAVGNAYYNVADSGAKTKYLEAIIFDRALEVDEIKGVASRSRVRLLNRNIVV